MKRLPVALALCALCSLARAGQPQDYATAWPLQLEADAPAHGLVLTEAVYTQVRDPQLRDLEAFNSAGEPLPLGPAPQPAASVVEPIPSKVAWFLLPAAGQGQDAAGELRLHVERDAEGRLRRLDARIPEGQTETMGGRDILLDLGEREAAIDRLELRWQHQQDLTARFRVETSNDLVDWRLLRGEVSLVDLQQGGFRLLRQRIDLPPTRDRYLRLTRLDNGADLQPISFMATEQPAAASAPALQWITLDAVADPDVAHGWRFVLPGPIPVSQVAVRLASANSVAEVSLSSRDDSTSTWRLRNQMTAFRIDDGDQQIEADPQSVGPSRDRQWQLLAQPALSRAPQLRVGYRPDEFVLLASGDGPFQLAAGSARAQRDDYPIASLLQVLRSRRGQDWTLPEARLGQAQTLAGRAALKPPLPWRQWVLWAVLIAGAALVIGMVLRLATAK